MVDPDDEPCLGQAIWDRARAQWPTPPRRAQDRAALDKFLRAEVAKITDPDLRPHVADVLRQHRSAFLFHTKPVDVWNYLASLDRRLTNIEAELHRNKRTGMNEIHSIRHQSRDR